MVSVIIPYNVDRGFLSYARKSVCNQTFPDYELIEAKGDCLLGYNINKALKYASGEYVKILAEDDLLTPNCLTDLVDGMGDYDFVCANAYNFGDPGWPAEQKSEVKDLMGLIDKYTIHGGTVLYRRQAIMAVGGWDETLWTAEEYDLHLKLLKNGYKLGYVDSFVYKYRIHSGQKYRKNRVEKAKLIEQIKKRYDNSVNGDTPGQG